MKRCAWIVLHIDRFYAAASVSMLWINSIQRTISTRDIQTTTGVTGMDVVAPSAFQSKVYRNHARELTDAEIREIINSFAKAAKRSKDAGFAGVQFHCAHGYLLYEFLSPYTNKRKDKCGGTTENRFRIMADIIDEARNLVG